MAKRGLSPRRNWNEGLCTKLFHSIGNGGGRSLPVRFHHRPHSPRGLFRCEPVVVHAISDICVHVANSHNGFRLLRCIVMGEGLNALHNQKIKSAKVDISAEGKHDIAYKFFGETKQYSIIEKELKASEFLKKQFRLVVNQLQAKNERALGGWVRVKEIEDDDELNAWKEVLG